MKLLPAIGFCLALLASAPALAQTPLDPLDDHDAKRLDRMEKVIRELRAIVFQGRETGKPVVVEPADTDSQLSSINDKLNDLQQTLTRINGQLEVTGHALDQAQREADQLREENGAVKDRLTRLEQKLDQLAAAQAQAPATDTAAAAASATGAPVTTDDPATLFTSSRRAFAARDFAGAQAGFQSYVDRFGDTAKAPEAQYYLGKSQLEQNDYANAAAAEVAAIRQWPQTSWAPDAVLDLSLALLGMKKPADACQTLGELARRYPRASATVKAAAAKARRDASCG